MVKDRTIEQLIHPTTNFAGLKLNFNETIYYNEGAWDFFESTLTHLRQVLLSFKENGFAKYWLDSIASKINNRLAQMSDYIVRCNMVKEDERLLDFPLSSDTITVNMLYFSQPHGIKVWGHRISY